MVKKKSRTPKTAADAGTPEVKLDAAPPAPELEFHEFANLLPMMSEKEYDELKRSILSTGIKEQITTYQGKIIDGRNRYKACLKLGLPVEPVDAGLTNDEQALDYVIARNLQRRNLTPSQKAVVALMALEKISTTVQQARVEKIRKAAGDGKLDAIRKIRPDLAPSDPTGGESGESEEIRTANIVGEMFGVSGSYVKYAKTIQLRNPKLLEQVAKGEKPLYKAYAEAVDSKHVQRGRPKLLVSDELDSLIALVKRRGMPRLLAKLEEAKVVLKEIEADRASQEPAPAPQASAPAKSAPAAP